MRRILVALVLLAAGTADAVELEEYDRWNVGVWRGSAHRDNQTHRFSHCAISRDYPNGISLVYWWTSHDEFQLVMVNRDWKLGDGQRFPLAITVDGRSLGRHEGVSSGDILMFVDFGVRPTSVVDTMKRGNRLWVQGGQHDHNFALADTFRGLNALEECAHRAIGAGFGDTVGEPSAETATSVLFDRSYLTELLREAGVADPEFLPDAELRDMPGVRHAWFHADTLGYVMEFDRTLATTTEEMRDYMVSLADDCSGRHREDILEPRSAGAAVVQQAISTCLEDDGFISTHYTGVFAPDRGTVTIIGHLANGAEDDAAMTVNDTLADILVRRFRNG